MIVSSNLIMLYVWFELSLVPIFLLIIYEGYQPERLRASIYMMVYTLTASLPLLAIYLTYLLIFNEMSVNNYLPSLVFPGVFSSLLVVFLFLAFLVKFPLYGVHYWLPLAHVQAPTGGSMVLAAILLKLGGVGLIKMSSLISPCNFLIVGLISWSLLGGVVSSFLCMVSQEMKVLVALSSVAHMSMAISVILTGSSAGLLSYVLILVSHAYSSSSLFLLVGVTYLQTGTRSMMSMFNLSSMIPALWLWGLLAVLANMGVPPTLNFISEIASVLSLVNLSVFYCLMISILLLLSVSFSVLLFSQMFLGVEFRSISNYMLMSSSIHEYSVFFMFSTMYFFSPLLFFSL